MKKLIVLAAALTLALSAAPAFAKGKKHAKPMAKKSWECNVGGNTTMTASVNECMKLGGMVTNYPGPDAAPVKHKKTMKHKAKAKTMAPKAKTMAPKAKTMAPKAKTMAPAKMMTPAPAKSGM